jgi:PAS domain S-box-containing protein
MANELRKTGISAVGDMPWGTHFCSFYETKQDLLDILIPFFKTGLKNNEFCLWIVSNSELLTMPEARNALQEALPDLDRYVGEKSIEFAGHDWFLDGGSFDFRRVANQFKQKVDEALARGYVGMRVNASPAWLETSNPKELRKFEAEVDQLYFHERIIASCTYPLPASRADFLLDVARNHRFAIARRHGIWDIVETPELVQAKAEIERLNVELERRVVERTKELEETTARLRVELEERKKREAELQTTARALRLISGSNLTLVRLTDETTVLNEVCRIAVEVGGYKMAWIGFAEQDVRKTVRPVAHAGFAGGYLESLNITWADEPQGRGPGGTAIRTGKPCVVRHIHEDTRFAPWRAEALRLGFQSMVALPLRVENRSFGFLAIYDVEPDGFDDGEVKVLTELANDLAFGITVLRTRAERDRALADLSESQRKLKEAERLANIGYWERDLVADRISLSKEIASILGLSRRVFTHSELQMMVHPDDRQQQERALQDALEGKSRYDNEYRVILPGGDTRFLHVTDEIVYDESARPVRMFGAVQDVTERKQTEQAFRESQQLLQLVLATLPVGVLVTNQAGDIVLSNEASKRIWGGAITSGRQRWAETKGFWHDSGERIAPISWASARALSQGQTSLNELIDIETYDGRQKIMQNSAAPIRNADGVIVGCVIVNEDVTERVRAEEALRRNEYNLRLVINTIPIMAWTVRPDGVVDFLNQRWLDYAGLSLEEYVKDPTGPIHPNDIPRVMSKWRAQMAIGEGYEDEMRLRRADGEYRWFLVRTEPMRDDGNVIKWYGVSTDIEDRKQAEEKLKETSKQLRALSASLQTAREQESKRIAREIHDELGGALTSWRWDLEEIRDDLSMPLDASQIVTVRNKIQGMIKLTETTLDTIRRLASELRPIALDELGLVEAIEWQARQFESRTGIAVKYECSLEKVDLNSEQSTAVFRILQEALTNIQRHAQATHVTITCWEESGQFILTIKDNGRGITKSEESATQSLGLLGMRERANLVGGVINIESAAGEGTKITVQVPISNSGRLRPVIQSDG